MNSLPCFLYTLTILIWLICVFIQDIETLNKTENLEETIIDKPSARYKRVTADGYHLNKAIFYELNLCPNHDKLVVVSDDGDKGDQWHILEDFTGRFQQPFTHVNIASLRNENHLQHLIHDLYLKMRMMTYVLMTSNPNDVMKSAESAFDLHKRHRLFAMPHHTQWLVIVNASNEFDQFVAAQEKSIFDNVAVLQIQPEAGNVVGIKQAVTLEWIPDRRRFPKEIRLRTTASKKCVLFPNRLYGLNGRRVTVFHKPFTPALLKTPAIVNNQTKQVEYTGVYVEILKCLSQTINFTYVFSPPPEENRHLSWGYTYNYTTSGRVDIGLNMWPNVYAATGNVSCSYPFLFDTATGMYIWRERPTSLSSFLLCPFPSTIYIFLGSCVVFCGFLYTVLEHVSLTFVAENENVYERYYSFRTVIRAFSQNVCPILISIMNVDSLPRPRLTSGRLVISVWSLGMVVFYSYYTSCLTSTMVKKEAKLPLNTFDKIMADDRFKIITGDNAFLYGLMAKSNDRLLRRVYENTHPISFYGDELQFAFESVKAMKNCTVTIYYKHVFLLMINDLQTYYNATVTFDNDIKDLMFMEEKLFSTFMSFAFPTHSEFEGIVSKIIVKMHENGLIEQLYNRYWNPEKEIRKSKSQTDRRIMTISDTYFLLGVVGSLIAVSTAVLVVEIVAFALMETCIKWISGQLFSTLKTANF